jgi:hypothetical protein
LVGVKEVEGRVDLDVEHLRGMMLKALLQKG